MKPMNQVATAAVLFCWLVSAPAAQDGQTRKPDSRPSKSGQAEAGEAIARAKPRKSAAKRRQGGYLGLFISDGVKDGKGVVTIDSVFKGSDAEKLGFRAGDEVVSVNGVSIPNGDRFIMRLWMSGLAAARAGRAGRGGRGARRPAASEIVVRRKGKEVVIPAGLKELDVHPSLGDMAPDFKLKSADGKTEILLSKLVGQKPLVLIFGSYT